MPDTTSILYQIGQAVKTQIAAAAGSASSAQSELDITQVGAGLATDGTYTPNASTNYLTAVGSLKAADEALDAQLKSANEAIALKASQTDLTTTNTSLSAAESAISTAESNITNLQTNKADLNGATFTGAVSGTSLSLSSDLTVTGNLQVLGEQTVTKITEANLDIKDNFIGLNRGASAAANNSKDIGLYFERGSSESAGAIVFDEANDKFVVGFLQDVAGTGSTLSFDYTNAAIGSESATGNFSFKFDLAGQALAILEANPTLVFSGGGAEDFENPGSVQYYHEQGATSYYSNATLSGNTIYINFDILVNDDQSNYVSWDAATYVAYLNMTQDEKDLNYAGWQTPTVQGYFTVGNSVNLNNAASFVISSNATGISKADPFTTSSIDLDSEASAMYLTTPAYSVASGGGGTPAADASAATAAATAAPLKVGSLEIADSALGDLADFNAGLTA